MIVLNGKTMNEQNFTHASMPLPAPANDAAMAELSPARLIGALEETSLVALVDYLADMQGRTTDGVAQSLCERFSISKLAALPAADYDEAVKYLVDQLPEEALPAEG